MAISETDFQEAFEAWQKNLATQSLGSGPKYAANGRGPVTLWHDQFFARNVDPVGNVNCPQALLVGDTSSGLDLVIVASHANDDELVIPAGATISVKLQQADTENGTFEDIGPAICVTAPVGGMNTEPDCVAARFAIGNFTKPWLMASVEFSGAITGGTVDVALAYMPR